MGIHRANSLKTVSISVDVRMRTEMFMTIKKADCACE